MKPEELTQGEIGSNQYLAYRIRSALNPTEIFGISTYSEEQFQEAIGVLAKAYRDYDLKFFRDQADGLKKLHQSDPVTSLDPRFFFLRAYSFLYRTKNPVKKRKKEKTLPTWPETILLAKRIWVVKRILQSIPDLPLPRYEPDLEEKIRREIDLLVEQNWFRIARPYGLKFSKAKPQLKRKNK